MAVDLLAKRDIVEIQYPANAAQATVPKAIWLWGTWNAIIASSSEEFVLCGINIYKGVSTTSTPINGQFMIEIGTCAAGSEVPIARVGSGFVGTFTGGTPTVNMFTGETLFIQPYIIP